MREPGPGPGGGGRRVAGGERNAARRNANARRFVPRKQSLGRVNGLMVCNRARWVFGRSGCG